jgi:hypothetical protein
MKKAVLLIVLAISATAAFPQKSIDALFEKYAGREGFTTVTINGNLFKLAACLGDTNDDDSFPSGASEIRILTQDDETLKVENFYDMVIKDIDLKNYEEFMRVKESDQDLRMLVRSEGNKFREFLLIAGGKDNALIQIKGNLSFDEAKKMSENLKKENGLNLTSDRE